MARPPKDPALRMDEDLRIPVTAEQKRLIAEAAAASKSDLAAWVRPILLKAANVRLRSEEKGKSRR
jgi:uncharacterized protein (DUF1778 family)